MAPLRSYYSEAGTVNPTVPASRGAGPVLRATGFGKTFGRTTVLRDLDLEVSAGEVRGLLGQNGSGKSTFIKLLSGFHQPDPGAQLELRGHTVGLPVRSGEASRLGLSIMHQDLALEPSMSVLDTFLLRGDGHRRALGRMRWRRERSRVSRALCEFGLEIDVDRPTGELAGTERSLVAMVRAFDRLRKRPGVLLLDEPTAALDRAGIERLFAAVRQVCRHATGVLFVTHDLHEVRTLCDSVTILRDGVKAAEGPLDRFDEQALVRAIVGRDPGQLYPAPPAAHPGQVVLRARDLSGRTLRGVGFDLHRGEILGLTGSAGMGQEEVPELLFGSAPGPPADVELVGTRYEPSPLASLQSGVVMLPADRQRLGGDMDASVGENLTLPILKRFLRRGRLDKRTERAAVRRTLEQFGVQPPDYARPLGQLSGGNQQKALLAKWLGLFEAGRVLLLHEPTQGVDVGARQEIFRLIRDTAERGVSVIYVSTEHEDLAHLCDRVLVIRGGEVVAEAGQADLSADLLTGLCLTGNPRNR